MNLQIYLGLEDTGANAITVGILSCFTAIIMGILYEKNVFETDNKYNRERKDNKEKQITWKILPAYQNKNLLNINLDCIISFNLMHIIYTSTKGG